MHLAHLEARLLKGKEGELGNPMLLATVQVGHQHLEPSGDDHVCVSYTLQDGPDSYNDPSGKYMLRRPDMVN